MAREQEGRVRAWSGAACCGRIVPGVSACSGVTSLWRRPWRGDMPKCGPRFGFRCISGNKALTRGGISMRTSATPSPGGRRTLAATPYSRRLTRAYEARTVLTQSTTSFGFKLEAAPVARERDPLGRGLAVWAPSSLIVEGLRPSRQSIPREGSIGTQGALGRVRYRSVRQHRVGSGS